MNLIIPDLKWYLEESKRNGSSLRCPFATVESCPRFYQSISLLGSAGSTSIEKTEDDRLKAKWELSDLWPKTAEQETIIYGNYKFFDRFCPEVSFDRFGYFATYLGRYSDELDTDLAHKKLGEMQAPRADYRWSWSSITPLHFTECPLYSILNHRNSAIISNNSANKFSDDWYKRPLGLIIIGIFVTVIGGIILSFFI